MLGAVSVDLTTEVGDALTGERQSRYHGGHALLGDVAAGEDDERLGLGGVASGRARVLALEYGELAVHGRGAQPSLVETRKAECALRNSQAESLDSVADT